MVFLNPATPYFLASLGFLLLAALGVAQLDQARLLVTGVRTLPDRWGMRGRYVLGHLAACGLIALVMLPALLSGAQGLWWKLAVVVSLALYLGAGWSIPRRPLVQLQRERKKLRLQTPGFINFVRVSLIGSDSPADILQRYAARPSAQRAELQAVARDALQLHRERQYRPFEAFREVARARGCQELIDLAEALAEAENQGSEYLFKALEIQEQTLIVFFENEIEQLLARRNAILMLFVALGLVIGILGNILWVFVGSPLLQGGSF